MADAYADKVVLLCHFERAPGGGATDAPTESAWLHTFNAGSANAQMMATRPVFGSYAAEFASNGSYSLSSSDTDLTFGSGDFCVEGRATMDNFTSSRAFASVYASSSSNSLRSWLVYMNTAKQLVFRCYVGSTLYQCFGTTTAVAGTTFSWAVERVGSNLYAYFNGSVVASGSITGTMNTQASGKFRIGADSVNDFLPAHMLDELRITKGVNRYGGSGYTPDTAPFEDPHFVSALRPVVFGTPILAHTASPLRPVHFGTPAWVSASALRPVHFGIPQLTFKVRHLRPVHFGVPLVLTNLIVPVKSLRPVRFGHPVAMVYNFRSNFRARSLRPTHFGKPTL